MKEFRQTLEDIFQEAVRAIGNPQAQVTEADWYDHLEEVLGPYFRYIDELIRRAKQNE